MEKVEQINKYRKSFLMYLNNALVILYINKLTEFYLVPS